MFLKRRVRRKDGKDHVYYSVCESLRVHGGRTIQRQILHLGEINTRQQRSWQHTSDVINEDVINEDVINEDVINEDVINEDVINENVINEDVINEDDGSAGRRSAARTGALGPRRRGRRPADPNRANSVYVYENPASGPFSPFHQPPRLQPVRAANSYTYTNLLQRAGWGGRGPWAAQTGGQDARRTADGRMPSPRGLPGQPPPRIRSRQVPGHNWPPAAGRHRKCVADLRAKTPGNPCCARNRLSEVTKSG